MPQGLSPKAPRMPFYRLGTLADMSRMVRNLVVAKKYMQDISAVEEELLGASEGMPEIRYNSMVNEMSRYASLAADSIREAIGILVSIRRSISVYKGSM